MGDGQGQAGRPVAAIDLGTNTALLLIARADGRGGLEVLEDHSRTCRLGEGLARSASLAPAAVERTLAVLREYLERIRVHDLRPWDRRAVGTAVLRRARDAAAFVARVREELGLEIEVLPEEEEARLGHLAVTAEGGSPESLVVDVGGGSTELVGEAGALRLSAPIGAVVLTETWIGTPEGEPLHAGGWPALRSAVAEACQTFPEGLARGGEVVLLGGTAVQLACLGQGLERFDPSRAEGARLPAAAAREWAERLAAMPVQQRIGLPIEADRASILPAGLACLAEVLERLGAGSVRISGRGLRYGIARELATK